MSVKKGIHKWHEGESINMVAKCIVHVCIIAELKAYLLSHCI